MIFEAAEVSLLVKGRQVIAQYEDTITFHINGTRFRRFLQSNTEV